MQLRRKKSLLTMKVRRGVLTDRRVAMLIAFFGPPIDVQGNAPGKRKSKVAKDDAAVSKADPDIMALLVKNKKNA